MNNAKLSSGTLMPAYGRDYKSKAALVADLNAGKDFTWTKMGDQGYVSIRDLEGTFQARYRSLRSVVMVRVKDGKATVA